MTEYKQLELFEDDLQDSATYYGQLGISEQASKMEIKKAYFSMVKKYPPERYPEEFKKYRKAYEILTDNNAREQYDRLAKIPLKYQQLYEFAMAAMEHEDYDSAIKQLKNVVKSHPELLIIKSLLGEIYLRNNNSGNAIKIFESLVRQEPGNAIYHGQLAHAYHMRGFTKKAVAQYQKALSMDSDNISLWSGLSLLYRDSEDWETASETLENGIGKFQENNPDNLPLHIQAIFVGINRQDSDAISRHLNIVKKSVTNGSVAAEDIVHLFFSYVFSSAAREEDLKYYCLIISFLDNLMPGNDVIIKLKTKIHMAYALYEAENDINVPDFIIDMTNILLENCNCPECTMDKILIESLFLDNVSLARKGLRYLKKTYPLLFELNKSFYNLVLEPKKERRLIEKNYKAMMALKKKHPQLFNDIPSEEDLFSDAMPLLDNNEPYIRQTKKIGRNDPCPCGSGKKYKRCCGANL